jgi:CheY-like chemotaxis protein
MMPAAPSQTILIVEDDRATRELYRSTLLGAGWRVVGVEDGLDALNVLEHARPAAVVLDLMLPRLGGLDVYNELRANPSTQRIPVIIVTGTDARGLESSDARQFIRKPIAPDTLIEAVQRALSTQPST